MWREIHYTCSSTKKGCDWTEWSARTDFHTTFCESKKIACELERKYSALRGAVHMDIKLSMRIIDVRCV
jgi:hypothetical protein